jgi:hypothetical protein
MLKDSIPSTPERVPLHTNKDVNERIRVQTEAKISEYANDRQGISSRLKELDREWDTERFLEANASTVVLVSVILGFAHSIYWFILAGLVGFFLLQHAIQGWCPPLPVIRRLGYRTADEINHERVSLKFLRGDFKDVCRRPQNVVDRPEIH